MKTKVLIVDDNKVNLDVAKGLIGQYHPQITTAMSGDEALNIYFSEHDFDEALQYADQIILMDKGTVRMSGDANKVLRSGAIEEVFGVKPLFYEMEGSWHCTVRPIRK